MMLMVKTANLALRFLLEICALASLGYWGFHTNNGTLAKIGFGIGAPLLAAFVWGMFVATKATVTVSEPLHLILEFAVFGAAVAALYAAGRQSLSVAFALVVLINRVLMSVWDQ